MNTSRWRTSTWFVLAMLILCAVIFGYGFATAPPCGPDCADLHGAARVSYELGWRSGQTARSKAFLIVFALLLVSGIAWVIADIRRPRRLYCAHCGTQIAPTAKFCPTCGQALR